MELEQVKQVVNESIKAAMGSIGEVIKATVKEKMELFGSAGKAE